MKMHKKSTKHTVMFYVWILVLLFGLAEGSIILLLIGAVLIILWKKWAKDYERWLAEAPRVEALILSSRIKHDGNGRMGVLCVTIRCIGMASEVEVETGYRHLEDFLVGSSIVVIYDGKYLPVFDAMATEKLRSEGSV